MQNMLFFVSLETRKVVKQKSGGTKKSNLIEEVQGLKTINKGNISFSRFLSERHQLDLHSYHSCMNKYRTFN